MDDDDVDKNDNDDYDDDVDNDVDYGDDDDEDAESDLPRISKMEECTAFINQDNRPVLKLDLYDLDDNPFVLNIIYIAERHKIETEIEAPLAS